MRGDPIWFSAAFDTVPVSRQRHRRSEEVSMRSTERGKRKEKRREEKRREEKRREGLPRKEQLNLSPYIKKCRDPDKPLGTATIKPKELALMLSKV